MKNIYKDLNIMNAELKENYPELYILDVDSDSKNKKVLVTNGTEQRWIIYSNLIRRGCKFTPIKKEWTVENIRKELNSFSDKNIELLDTYIKKYKKSGDRYVVLTNGEKVIERRWSDILKTRNVNFNPRIVYQSEKIKELIDTYLYDCEIISIEDRNNSASKKASIYITCIYKKREFTNTLRHIIKRKFTENLNEDSLKEKNKLVDWNRFSILRLYSKKIGGKFRILVDIKDNETEEILYALNSDNLPTYTLSGENLSIGELVIKNWLIKNNIEFIKEKTFIDLKYKQNLRFDFYLPNNNIAIEYDGIFHYKAFDNRGGEKALRESKKRDNIKNTYCKKHNIKLIRIPYWHFKNIDEILSQDIV